MRYSLLFVFFILFNTKNVWAKVGTSSLDTSIDRSNYKEPKHFFLENYGKDDSSKALINYFFRKRKTAFYQTVIPIVVGGGLTILLAKAFNRNNIPVTKDDYGGIVIAGALVTVVLQSAGQIIDGQITWLVFSRHKLLKTLVGYNSGQPLPKRITRRKQFRQELEALEKPRRRI